MVYFLIRLINFAASAFNLFLLVYIITTYILAPWHPVRRSLAQVFEPILRVIRRYVPPVGMFDLSPLVLILLVEVLRQLLVGLLSMFL
ncbi:MAG: YggT family protein [Chloroflexi bacterium]|nr:YggT family protein [Chloroflexota bacterium]